MSLKLVGKKPNTIFLDCNFKDALVTTKRSSFANQGQIYLYGLLIFVD